MADKETPLEDFNDSEQDSSMYNGVHMGRNLRTNDILLKLAEKLSI